MIPSSASELLALLVDSQDAFMPESVPFVKTQGTIIPELLRAYNPNTGCCHYRITTISSTTEDTYTSNMG
jgi:hypothetical protein